MTSLFQPSPEVGQVLRNVFDRMRQQADAGDEEAELVVAWCRFHGLGTDADVAAAMPTLEARAEAGHLEACFATALWAMEEDDTDRAAVLALRAAEKGHVQAMLMSSQFMRNKGDRKGAAAGRNKRPRPGAFQP